tara:strand:- start:4077 stop:5075 length:999 start_codon:yes stop_codon:yes gene_type:complete
MIITRCPYRVSFFGGGTDFPSWYREKGCNIVTCSIDAYCYITIRKLLPFYGNDYRISWSKIEEVKDIKKIEHPAIKGALDFFKIKNGLEIHTDGDLPARSGLGSSSAFSSALILALSVLKGKYLSTRELTDKTIYFEQEILKENVGIQDQIQTCCGGFNLLSINKKGQYRLLRLDIGSELVQEISKRIMLVYTGFTRTSSDFQKESQKINNETRYKSLEKIANLSNTVTDRILKEDLCFNDFSNYLEKSWESKVKLFPDSYETQEILKIYKEGKKFGASSGKLLGAGGGGFFLFLVEEKLQKKFVTSMKKYTVVKQNITNSPCKLLFDSKSE